MCQVVPLPHRRTCRKEWDNSTPADPGQRSAGDRRQQLKWLYTGAIVFMISVFLPGQVGNDPIGPLGAVALPVCIGVAVLKYRLFASDRIISR
jgi:hypothetical protein